MPETDKPAELDEKALTEMEEDLERPTYQQQRELIAALRAARQKNGYTSSNERIEALEQQLALNKSALANAVPRTYGELVRKVGPYVPCEPHEWDNRTTLENVVWALATMAALSEQMTSLKADYESEADQHSAIQEMQMQHTQRDRERIAELEKLVHARIAWANEAIEQVHNAQQVIEGWFNTTPANEWSAYDEDARLGLGILQAHLYNLREAAECLKKEGNKNGAAL